jgi:hypothetical protein
MSRLDECDQTESGLGQLIRLIFATESRRTRAHVIGCDTSYLQTLRYLGCRRYYILWYMSTRIRQLGSSSEADFDLHSLMSYCAPQRRSTSRSRHETLERLSKQNLTRVQAFRPDAFFEAIREAGGVNDIYATVV